MSGADIEFHLETIADEQRFIREYLVAAWDRFETNDYFESGWFWPYGASAEYESGPDGGFIRLVFEGNPSALVDSEKSHWEEFDDLHKWEIRRYEEEGFDSLLAQQRDAKGEVAGE